MSPTKFSSCEVLCEFMGALSNHSWVVYETEERLEMVHAMLVSFSNHVDAKSNQPKDANSL